MSEAVKGSFFSTVKSVIGHLRKPLEDHPLQLGAGRYNDADLDYMQSLSAAVVQRSPRFIFWVIGVIALALFMLTLWMAWAELDTVVKAQGKVIPTSQVQKVQTLEGGVVSEILVQEGDEVRIDQPLMKISDIPFLSSYQENSIKYLELKARITRLSAEANNTSFSLNPEVQKTMPKLLISEESLFKSNRAELQQNVNILHEQIKQAQSQLLETEAKERQLARSLSLLQQEVKLKKPLVDRHLLSEVDYLQLQGQESKLAGELESMQLSIPRIKSTIEEAERNAEHSMLEFRNRARKELNEAVAEASRINEVQTSLADRVARTTLRSPVNGTVMRIHNNTVGGVVSSGSDIIEIVPREDALLIEAQIKPADIGNVEVGQLSRIKFTAYDFAIYGSVKGEVLFISADTITDEKGESYYIVRLRPEQAYLGHESRKLYIKVGMTTEVGIITGKNTILHYLLKPINRAMDSALREG